MRALVVDDSQGLKIFLFFYPQASRPGFFRQNSARSFKLLDLRKSTQQTHSAGRDGVSSPSQLSPPSTPTGSEHTPWLPGDLYSRTCRRIPTVCAWFIYLRFLYCHLYSPSQNEFMFNFDLIIFFSFLGTNTTLEYVFTMSYNLFNRLYWGSTARLRLGLGRNISDGSIIMRRQVQGEVTTLKQSQRSETSFYLLF